MVQEEIDIQCNKYAEEVIPSYTNGDFDRIAIRQAFKDGVKWHIESVWHIGEEEADIGSLILIESRQGNVFMIRFYGEWNEIVRKYVIKHWAYVKDLMSNK